MKKKLTPKSKLPSPRDLTPEEELEPLVHIPEPETNVPKVGDIDFNKVQPQTKMPRLFKQYPQEECAEDGCDQWAVGSDIYCEYHGGDPIIRENLLENQEIPISMLGKYKPEYHPMAYLNYAKQGLSNVQIAAELGVSTQIMKEWSEKFLDFNTAYEVGQALIQSWYEKKGKDNLENRGFNTNLYKLLTGNILGWSDKTESKSLNVHAGVLVVPERMSEEEWEDEHGD